jgi:hypothetical protein
MTTVGTTFPFERSAHLATRAPIVLLTLTTAAIHASLGGWLFAINAVGYTTLATLMLVPGPVGRFRFLVRLGLLGFTTATIVGWLLIGARFSLAYVDKAVEVAVVVLLATELFAIDGGPRAIAGRLIELARLPFGERARNPKHDRPEVSE